MTNEQLAVFIKQDSPELVPVLWERIRKLMYSKAKQYYSKYQSLCERCGVTVDDIKQECYPAFLEALKAYTSEQEYKFTTFLGYPFQNHVNSLTGQRTNAMKQLPLNNSASIDEPLTNADGDDCTRLDLLVDDNSLKAFNEYEESDTQRVIREELSKLSEQYQIVLRLRYFENKTLEAIGTVVHVSKGSVQQIEHRALRELRKSKVLRQMYGDFKRHYTWSCFSRFQYSPEYFDLIHKLQEREHQGEYISYGNKQATIQTAAYAFCKNQVKK